MSSILEDCPVCKRPYTTDKYTSERRKTINFHTDMKMCIPCDKDYTEAQNNYRKWGLKIGQEGRLGIK